MAKVYQTIICGRTFPTRTSGRVSIHFKPGATMQKTTPDGEPDLPPYQAGNRRIIDAKVFIEPSGNYLWENNGEVIRIFADGGDKVRR